MKAYVDIFHSPLERKYDRIQDDIRFMRIRTKRHELMISPGESRIPAYLAPQYKHNGADHRSRSKISSCRSA